MKFVIYVIYLTVLYNFYLANCFQEKQYAGVNVNTLHPINKSSDSDKITVINKDAWIVLY